MLAAKSTKRSGFTFIELLLTMGVMGIIAGVATPTYRNYKIRSDLYLARDVVLQALYRARLLSQSGEFDDEWRYEINEGIVFKGSDFDTRDPNYDELFTLPNSVVPTGIQEVAFERINGAPSPDGDIVLQSLSGEKIYIPISPDTAIIGESAPPVQVKVRFDRIEDDDGMVTFCHKPGTGAEETMTLPEQAWNGHHVHGDDLNPCPGDEGDNETRNVVYVGSGSTVYYEGEWIPLTENGVVIVDGALSYDEEGIYLRRTASYAEFVHYNDDADTTTIIDTVIFMDGDTLTSVQNGTSPNETENPFDGTVNDTVSGDEVTTASDNKSVQFQTREDNGQDTINLYWGS